MASGTEKLIPLFVDAEGAFVLWAIDLDNMRLRQQRMVEQEICPTVRAITGRFLRKRFERGLRRDPAGKFRFLRGVVPERLLKGLVKFETRVERPFGRCSPNEVRRCRRVDLAEQRIKLAFNARSDGRHVTTLQEAHADLRERDAFRIDGTESFGRCNERLLREPRHRIVWLRDATRPSADNGIAAEPGNPVIALSPRWANHHPRP